MYFLLPPAACLIGPQAPGTKARTFCTVFAIQGCWALERVVSIGDPHLGCWLERAFLRDVSILSRAPAHLLHLTLEFSQLEMDLFTHRYSLPWRPPRLCSEPELPGVVLPDEHRGTSFIRKRLPLGPYSRPEPRALWRSWGVACSYERGTPVNHTSLCAGQGGDAVGADAIVVSAGP